MPMKVTQTFYRNKLPFRIFFLFSTVFLAKNDISWVYVQKSLQTRLSYPAIFPVHFSQRATKVDQLFFSIMYVWEDNSHQY